MGDIISVTIVLLVFLLFSRLASIQNQQNTTYQKRISSASIELNNSIQITNSKWVLKKHSQYEDSFVFEKYPKINKNENEIVFQNSEFYEKICQCYIFPDPEFDKQFIPGKTVIQFSLRPDTGDIIKAYVESPQGAYVPEKEDLLKITILKGKQKT